MADYTTETQIDVYRLDSDSSEESIKYEYTIEKFVSLIWTKRLREAGDFELVLPLTTDILQNIQLDDILVLTDDYKNGSGECTTDAMIVENISITSPTESDAGNITIKGRDTLSWLDKRVLLEDYESTDDPLTIIQHLINDNFSSSYEPCSDNNRKVKIFWGTKNSYDISMSSTKENTIDAVIGDNVYDLIKTMLARDETKDYWIKSYLVLYPKSGSNEWEIVFCHNDNQDEVSKCIFSVNNGHITDWSIYMTNTETKNVGVIIGDNDISVTTYIGSTEPSGIQRREGTWTPENMDKRSSESTTKYKTRLTTKGQELLREQDESYDGDCSFTTTGRYDSILSGLDAVLGYDLNLDMTRYTAIGKVTEIVHNWDYASGYTCYPSFELSNIKYKDRYP